MTTRGSKPTAKAMTQREKRIYDFLNRMGVGVLASVSPNNEPHATVIYFVIEPNFLIRFLTKTGTKKYENILKNKRVTLAVFEAKTQSVVQVYGEAMELKNAQQINEVADAVNGVSNQTAAGNDMPIAKLDAGEFAAFQIIPKQINMASYARRTSSDHSRMFDSIESFELEPTD